MKYSCQYAFSKAISDTKLDPIIKQHIIRECMENEHFDINYEDSDVLIHAINFCDYY